MVRKRCSRILVLTIFAALFVFAFACTAFAEDTDPVIYDATQFSNLNGRTQSDVMEKYTQAQAEGTKYINSSSASYYDVPVSLRAPYAIGVISADTLKAMEGMTNFYRWLIGVENLAVNTESNASLQAQAFDRNFEFDHYISNSSKPADMDDALWQQGFACNHNILASGSTPSGAVTNWLNEGYKKSDGTWDAIGHRTAILSAGYKSIGYGYSGYIAVGKCGPGGNTFANAFAAFPAAGYMPAELLYRSESAWTVQLNSSVVKAASPANVRVTVKNLRTGESYTCQNSDGTANNSTYFLWFNQSTDTTSSYYSDSYQVTATGLTDVATGGPAEIRYTVNFFSLPRMSSISIPRTLYAYTGSAIEPEVTVNGNSGKLTAGQDYTVTYHNNKEVGKGIVEVKGKGNYCGTLKKAFTIEVDRKDMEQCSVTLSPTSGRYTGDPIKPTVTVKSFGNTLTQGEDYEVSYRNNVEPGTGVVTVRGIGEYRGSVEKTFTIYKGTQSVSASLSARTLEVGATGTIIVTARYEDPEITLSSTDESVATVDPDGTIHVLGEGTFRIKITASETEHYNSGSWNTVEITGSKDVHTMVDTDVVYATDENETATATRTCAVCGKTETASFTTVRTFYSIWYWKGNSASTYINPAQTEGAAYTAELNNFAPSDAENTEFVLQSSDPNVMTINGDSFTFVGAGTVTLTIYAKYRPTTKITKTFTVSHAWDAGVVTTEPRCDHAGVRTYTCQLCYAEKTEAIDKLAHTPREAVTENEVPPTCTKEGSYDEVVYCDVCKAEISRETKANPARGHNKPMAETPAVAATCTEAGSSAYWYCSACEKYFADQNGDQQISENSWIIPATGHKWDAGVITTAPTATKTGVKTFTCTVCGVTKEETVPARNNQVASDGTKVGAGASEEVANKAITGMKTDSDPAGSAFRLLRAKSTKQGQTYVTVSWSKVKGAKKYVIYGNACGKTNKMKKLATVTGSYYTVKKVITNKGKKVKVRKGTYYKFIVVALNGSRNVVSTSKVIHVATTGGKVGNDKYVTTKAKKNAVTVKVGKTFYLGAKAVPASKKKAVKRHRGLKYETTNKAIATVSAKGTITGKKKGSCSVYVYAQNGICKRISVTVK